MIDTPHYIHPVTLSIGYNKIRIESKRHDYLLQIALKNVGPSNISDWHVDVFFPTQLMDPKVTYTLKLPENSDIVYSLLRSTHNTHPGIICPGDNKIIMALEYYVDTNIYLMRRVLFRYKVTATCYVHEHRVGIAERTVNDLHIFKHSWFVPELPS